VCEHEKYYLCENKGKQPAAKSPLKHIFSHNKKLLEAVIGLRGADWQKLMVSLRLAQHHL
jgi:hypothetical protein